MKTLLQGLIVITFAILSSACMSTGGEQKVDFSYVIEAADSINPDINGRPSSVVVRVFQLSNQINFENASYDDLFASANNTLGTEFISVDEYLIDPGARKEIEAQISENAKFIGVVVGYRSIDMVTWRTISPVEEKSFFRSSSLDIKIYQKSVRVIAN